MRVGLLFLGLFLSALLSAFTLPYSETPVHSDDNLVTDLTCLQVPKHAQDSLSTRCWIWYDYKALHVDWEMQIDDGFHPGNLGQRDASNDGDDVEIDICTSRAERMSYFFFGYPTGVESDGVRDSNLNTGYRWDSKYDFTQSIIDSLWTCSMTIPFNSMRIYGKAPFSMGFVFSRYYHHNQKRYGFPFVDETDPPAKYYGDYLWVTLDHDIDRAHNYRISPYFARSYDLLNHTQTFDPDHVGLNLEYRPAGSVSIKAAFHPDYSEIPMDTAQDTHNSKYPPYYFESRFFFTEDINAFGVGELFFTRNIAEPQYAVKVTGNTPYLTYGLLNAYDKRYMVDGFEVHPADIYSVAALRPHYENVSCQFALLSRMNPDDKRYGEVGMISPKWDFLPGHTLTTNFIGSLNDQKDLEQTRGYYLRQGYSFVKGDWSGDATYKHASSDYYPCTMQYWDSSINPFNMLETALYYNHNYDGDLPRFVNLETDLSATEVRDTTTYYMGAYASITGFHDQSFTISGDHTTELYNGKVYEEWTKRITLSFTFFDNPWTSLSWYHDRSLVYALEDTRINDCYQVSAGTSFLSRGYIGGYLSHYVWDYPKTAEQDDEYNYLTVNARCSVTEKLSMRGGINFDDYEAWGVQQSFSAYANLRWDYSDTWSFYAGFTNNRSKAENVTMDLSKTVWFKVNSVF
jgi:hypothetical protein